MSRNPFRTKLLTLPMAMLLAGPAHAAATDALIEGAKQCTRHLPRYERQYGIPVHLLSAISSTESGRWHDGLRIAVPWPWTINAEGKGYYFDSKQEAITAVRRLQAQGVRSIDVGCMQVNLVHHASAFARLEDAFDPETNIAYAATFLRNLYQESGSWKQAAAAYHSKTPVRGEQYVGRVFSSWYKIIDKVRAARQVAAAAPAGDAKTVQVAANAAQPVQIDEAALANEIAAQPMPAPPLPTPKPAVLAEQEGKKLAPFKSPQMRVVEVSRKSNRESPVMIVRPEVDDQQVAAVQALTSRHAGFEVEPYRAPKHRDSTLTVAASAQPAPSGSAMVVNEAAAPVIPVAAAAPDAKVIQLNRTSSRKSGPNFIFQ